VQASEVPHQQTEEYHVNTLAEFGTGQLLWSMLWFFMFVIWFWLLITVFGDIFRSEDLGGWGKALWIIFIVLFVWLGVLAYFIARGKGMQERSMKAMAAQQAAQQDYIRSVASPSTSSSAEEIARLADLRDKGVLSEEEFQAAKAKALA
jgi:type VI protein secretion system component VasK